MKLAAQIMQKLHGGNIWEGFDREPDSPLVPGWNGTHKQLTLSKPILAVDVGVYLGQSTIFIASYMKNNKIDGCVVSIDTFLGSPEIMGHIPEFLHGRPTLYESFLSNVKQAGLTDYVVPFPIDARSGAEILLRKQIFPDFIHIDAAHDYNSVFNDSTVFWKILRPGGTMVGDDYDWTSVSNAANMFARELGLKLIVDLPKWVLRKPDDRTP